MKRFRDFAILAAIAGLAAYQGRQLHIYAASSQAPAAPATQNTGPSHGGNAPPAQTAELAAAGGSLFQQNCAFCHWRDAGGGEAGPDLTRSKLVAADVNGSNIASVVRYGPGEGKMPKFTPSDTEMTTLVAFIHAEAKLAAAHPGGRRGVHVADLQKGNLDARK